MSKEIQLRQGQIAIVDDEDYELVSRFKWYLKKDKGQLCYAVCQMYMGKIGGKSVSCLVSLHRLVMRPPREFQIDHKDHNGLNCQHNNMRCCSGSQNQANSRPRQNCSSQFKGVSWKNPKWRARITIKGEIKYLGCFSSEIEAAKIYDEATKAVYGEFACTNF